MPPWVAEDGGLLPRRAAALHPPSRTVVVTSCEPTAGAVARRRAAGRARDAGARPAVPGGDAAADPVAAGRRSRRVRGRVGGVAAAPAGGRPDRPRPDP